MGVPKFFRFISERYPAINKVIKKHEIPEFDNLYLDMNSIIHRCSHPEDSDIHFRVGKKEFSDEEIFQNVSRYVELIFCIVKPVELMFLAFDGVAPRAKMNQQRSHRFRVSMEMAKLNEDGIPDDDLVFDANCVTPGTQFMCELIDHMKHFIAYKISVDPLWQKCKIILSGSEVPGEGEHKIMQYIRFKKAQSDYNHNTRHCLYSLDADLIMLGLCTHEPYFSILRENVTFGKRKNMLTPEESDFHLLHLSLVRDYLDCEFSPLKTKLKSKYDLEKIVDDWVLIEFLVGNDFIPQLPDFLIVNGALPLIYKTYIQVLPQLDGYLHDSGDLNLNRFQEFLSRLPVLEPKVSTLSVGSPVISRSQKTDVISDNLEELVLETKDASAISENSPRSKSLDSSRDEQSQSEKSTDRLEYYKTKLKFGELNGLKVRNLVEDYIKAIQWTLSYYYHGCCSWSWYYPYHYAPLLSDIREITDVKFDFRLSEPFLPLQHLLAVLPAQNNHLLPKSLRSLVTSPKSPIIDWYPETFEVDLNGKSNDWEAIVLIPFIEEEKLIKAMEPYVKQLNFKERKRNVNGSTCIFSYSSQSLGQYPVDTIFDSFDNHAQLQSIKAQDLHVPKNKLVKGLCSNFNYDYNFAGFPTLKYIPHSFGLEETKSKFQSIHPPNVETMVLNLTPKPIPKLEEIAELLLGQSVFVNWPHFKEAHVIGVTDMKNDIYLENFWKKYDKDNVKVSELDEDLSKSVRDNTDNITTEYEKNLGIKIQKTDILVYVFPLMGKRYVNGRSGKMQLQSRWSTLTEMIPYQLVLKQMRTRTPANLGEKNISDVFNVSSTCFMIDQPHYGAVGKITGFKPREQRVNVTLSVAPEPNWTSLFDNFFANKISYIGCPYIAKELKISPTLISRITGSFIVTEISEEGGPKYHDIGLHLKIPKNNKELLGYTKKINDRWSYSDKVKQLLSNYKEKFPNLFAKLPKDPNSASIILKDLSAEGLNELNLIKSWLKEQQESYNTVFLECGTKTLGSSGVSKLEELISESTVLKQEPRVIEFSAPMSSLFKPGIIIGLVPPDVKAQHKLLDRIICVKENFTVPIGLKGTIVGIQEKDDKWKNVYEVLFDSSFAGGLSLYGSSENRCYRLMVSDFINITYGQKNKASSETQKSVQKVRDKLRTSGTPLVVNSKNDKSTNNSKTVDKTPVKQLGSQRHNMNNKGKSHPSNKTGSSQVKVSNDGQSNQRSWKKTDKTTDKTAQDGRDDFQRLLQNKRGAHNNQARRDPKNRQKFVGDQTKITTNPSTNPFEIDFSSITLPNESSVNKQSDDKKCMKNPDNAKKFNKSKSGQRKNIARPAEASVTDRISKQPHKNCLGPGDIWIKSAEPNAPNCDKSGTSIMVPRRAIDGNSTDLSNVDSDLRARFKMFKNDAKSKETKKDSTDSPKNSCRPQ
ncbi:hypothetical protein QAD02_004801 [Eretmocerus hayati]|uniref:Uncharacterized protein n=1 Tax=Eretmocerus hayati TaxID=131215 RepID=A0ACC2NQL8_9HYME|nr:hypothetical protein QAD02_004801 [Eretmocerus hayati]